MGTATGNGRHSDYERPKVDQSMGTVLHFVPLSERRYLDATVDDAVRSLDRVRGQLAVALRQLALIFRQYPPMVLNEAVPGTLADADAQAPQVNSATGSKASDIDTLNLDANVSPEVEPSAGGIPVGCIFCSSCGSGEDDHGDELLLCDGAGCDRAWHLHCLPLPMALDPPSLDNEDEDWICPLCECSGDILNALETCMGGSLAATETVEAAAVSLEAGSMETAPCEH